MFTRAPQLSSICVQARCLVVILYQIHFVSCAWFALPWLIGGSCEMDDEPCNWVTRHGLSRHATSIRRMYVKAVYWTVATMTTVGYGDIIPENEIEELASIIVMLIGSLMFAYIFGLMATYVASMDHTTSTFKMKVDSMERFMEYRDLPDELRRRIMRYHDHTWIQTKGFDEISIIKGALMGNP